MFHRFFNDIRNCVLDINFRFSQTNNFSQVIEFNVLSVLYRNGITKMKQIDSTEQKQVIVEKVS